MSVHAVTAAAAVISYKVMVNVARPFVVAVSILWLPRFWGVPTMRAQAPGMYQRLGQPELFRAYWGYVPSGFLRWVLTEPGFGVLTRSLRYIFRAARLFNLTSSGLFAVLIISMLMMCAVYVARQFE